MVNWIKRSIFAILLLLLVGLMGLLAVISLREFTAFRATNQTITVTPAVVAARTISNTEQPSQQATATAETITAFPEITLHPITEGLENPTYLTHAYDDRLFITERPGRVRIITNGELLPTPFLDITDLVDTEVSEQGMLNIVFHPHYHDENHLGNGRFFIHYINNDDNNAIVRYQVDPQDPNRADPDSASPILTIAQPYERHNGGQLAFGPDGYLYLGIGDGGNLDDIRDTGQDTTNLLGTILRIDVDQAEGYAVPDDNPFINDDTRRNEIWAYGLRNPWRFSFDRLTGDLYIGDVGQNSWEELNFQPFGMSGLNYGWSITEGENCFSEAGCNKEGLTLPILTYSNKDDVGCSITGGYVYRGQQFPALAGTYLLGDFCQGFIWGVRAQADGWQHEELFRDSVRIATFGEDAQGELYVLGFASGTVYQIQTP